MRYWLFKSEPSTWSWDDQIAKGDEGEEWDGVRNYQARNFMRDMKLGDRGFFYHSQKEKSVVGIVEVCATAHQDSTTEDARWECVDIKAVRKFFKSCLAGPNQIHRRIGRDDSCEKLTLVRAAPSRWRNGKRSAHLAALIRTRLFQKGATTWSF